MPRDSKPVILVVDDLRESFESLIRHAAGHADGALAAEFDFEHVSCYAELRDWYARNRSRFVSLIVQDVDFTHLEDERKLVDYPDILKPIQRTFDIRALQGFLIYGYLRQENIDRVAPVIFVSCRVGMESTGEFTEFIMRPGYGICSFVPESAVGDEYYPKIAAAIDHLALRPLTDDQRREWAEKHGMVVGRSRKMAYLVYEIERIGPSDATALLLGAPGSGKELVANALHRCSYRYTDNDRYPLTVNMAALGHDLIEDELFGHVRGAYTGAAGERQGIFEAAGDSTVFLDEIGDVDQDVQLKLLRAMENHRIKRIGSSRETDVEMRIVAATNRTIEDLQVRFRPDFYSRLVQHCIPVPSLRDRWEGETQQVVEADLQDIFNAVIEAMNSNPRHKRHLAIERTAVKFTRQMVQDHIDGANAMFPGNVRTLRNVIERAYERAQYDGSAEIGLGHIMPALGMSRITQPSATQTPAQQDEPPTIEHAAGTLDLARIERKAIQEALRKTGGHRTQAAQILGIHRDTLHRKLTEHNIQ
jgi:two-component system response regulator AtoC